MKKRFKAAAALTAVLLLLSGCSSSYGTPDPLEVQSTAGADSLKVHTIDVGQGDAAFIELPGGETMLIDAGEPQYGDTVIEYIENLGYGRIDYLIATHPHADHIGGLPDVIDRFEVGSVYMPKAQTDSKIFERLLLSIQNKGLKASAAKAGVSILNENGLSAVFLAPNSDAYSDLNNYSAVLKLTYGSSSFLFTGDAEALSEQEITADCSADVLKVGHHGSAYSTSDEFLQRVSPAYAIISCGAGNQYGHPAPSTLEKLQTAGVEVFRTDELGTILFECDGSGAIQVNKKSSTLKEHAPPADSEAPTAASIDEPSSEIPPVSEEAAPPETAPVAENPSLDQTQSTAEETVYVTNTGSKYHRNGCQYLNRSKISISLTQAQQSYSPCSRCNPPQ